MNSFVFFYCLFCVSSILPEAVSQQNDNYQYLYEAVYNETGSILCAERTDNKSESLNHSQNETDENKINLEEHKSKSQKTTERKECESIKSNPIQYCRGKYEKLGDMGFEIITVRCPEVTSKCICDIDIKNFTEYIDCGGVRKNATKGSEIRECDSVIISN